MENSTPAKHPHGYGRGPFCILFLVPKEGEHEATSFCGGAAGAWSSSAAIPARADFGVVRFHGGFCRVWPDTAMVPFGGQYLAFHRHWGGHHWWQYRVPDVAGANMALHVAALHHRCAYINT